MSIFDIQDIRKQIFSYVYPPKVTKGMVIQITKTIFKPMYNGKLKRIHEIIKTNKGTYTIVLYQEPERYETMWYCVYSYLYPSLGDKARVVSIN